MNVAIIVAAGCGSRMGGESAKQYLELAGTPIIIHTLKAFELSDVIHEIIVVLPAAEAASFLALAGKYGLRKVTRVVPGGPTRAASVLQGLQAVRPATVEVVAVHDGVRPLVSPAEINNTVNAALEHEAAILVAPLTDTIKQVDDDVVLGTVSRSGLRRALTPQCFRYSLLRSAYDAADVNDPEITDECLLVERLGVNVKTVEGSPRNIKITTRKT